VDPALVAEDRDRMAVDDDRLLQYIDGEDLAVHVLASAQRLAGRGAYTFLEALARHARLSDPSGS